MSKRHRTPLGKTQSAKGLEAEVMLHRPRLRVKMEKTVKRMITREMPGSGRSPESAAELMEKRLRGWVYERAPRAKSLIKRSKRGRKRQGEVAALKESIETDKILKSVERAEVEEERRQGRKAEVARIHARARDLAEARFEREKREQEEAVAKAVEDEILCASKLEEKVAAEEMHATKTERDVMEESENARGQKDGSQVVVVIDKSEQLCARYKLERRKAGVVSAESAHSREGDGGKRTRRPQRQPQRLRQQHRKRLWKNGRIVQTRSAKLDCLDLTS